MNLSSSVAFVLAAIPLCAADPGTSSSPAPKEWLVYFGTYTGPKSQGIYVSKMDLASGKLSGAELAAKAVNPSFLALHPSEPFLYAVSEIGQYEGKKTGAVSAYQIDRQTGKLTLLNQQPSGGDGPCHLVVDHAGKAVLVANYGGGSCSVIPITEEGRLGAPSSVAQHKGSSVNAQRQKAPHAHGIYVDAANQFALVPDLGLDQVLIYRYDAARGSLNPNDPPFAPLAPGSGPRHLAFHPNGKFAYVINEMLCTVTAFAYDPSAGQLRELQTLSSLPPGETVARNFSTAEIEVHPSGKFLYGSNRGHDSIAVFAIDSETGKLRPVQHQSTQGKTPRSFGIEPTGKYLLAANQGSDNVVIFKIDPENGRLAATGRSVGVGAPVCVKFIAPE